MIEKLKKIKEENKQTRNKLKNDSNAFVLTIKDGLDKLEKIEDYIACDGYFALAKAVLEYSPEKL